MIKAELEHPNDILFSEEEKIYFNEIANLKIPLLEIVSQIKGNINSKKYGLLVSDNTGGYIPTLILGRMINMYYDQTGEKPIPSIFIQGSRNQVHLSDMYHSLESNTRALSRVGPEQKALLVTEHIGMGVNLKNFTTIFNSLQIPFDVAAVEASCSERRYQLEKCLPDDSNLFPGDSEIKADFIDFPYSGLNQEKYGGDKFIQDKLIREKARLALKDVRTVSNQLLEAFKCLPNDEFLA